MKSVPYLVLAFSLALPAVLVGIELPSWFSLGSQKLALESDLRVFYTPGYMLRTGQRSQIYDFSAIRRNQAQKVAADNAAVPFLHPAYEALLFAPLSFLPYRSAYLVWVVLDFGVLGLVYVLLQPCLLDLTALGPSWIAPLLLLGFMPVAFTILAGQDSLLLLLVLILVFHRISTNQLEAGILLGLGMFRFQVLLPIVALFVVWRSVRFVTGWVLGSAAVLGLSVAITGISAQLQYATLLRQMSYVSAWLLLRRMPGLRALFVATGIGLVPLLFVYAAIFIIAGWLGTRLDARHRLLLSVLTSTLVTYYLFMHDLSILVLPLMVGISESIEAEDWVRMGLISSSLAGFAIFWFAPDSFYLGVLFTMLFFGVEIFNVWSARAHTATLPQAVACAEK